MTFRIAALDPSFHPNREPMANQSRAADISRRVALSCILFMALGCQDSSQLPPAAGALGSGTPPLHDDSCVDGTERRCSVQLTQTNGVHSCFLGTKSCRNRRWGPCEEGRLLTLDRSGIENQREGLALSGDPVSCENDCDPSCQHWAEPGNLSGALPLTVPNFPGGPSLEPSCAHELCSPGPALNASCDPCVTQICTDLPGCCGAAGGIWDELCVDAVYQTCLNTERPLSLCDFGLYSSSSNQVTLNDLQSNSDINLGGLGNISVTGHLGHNVKRILTAGPVYISSPELPPLGVIALGDITLQPPHGGARVGSLTSGAGVNLYNLPIVDGDVFAQNNIVWETNIYGNATAGGNVNLAGGCASSVFGGLCTNGSPHAAPSLTLPTLPGQSFSCGGPSHNVTGPLSLPPGDYGDVVVQGELHLDGAGPYSFQRLYVRDLKLDGGAERINLEICNEMNFYDGGRVLDASGALQSNPSLLFASALGNLHFGANVQWVGVVQSASSGTKVGGSIHGAIWSSPVNDIVSQTSIIGIPRDDCLSMGLPGTAPPACPILNVGAPVPAALSEPCASGLDCQINHRCVEPVTDGLCIHGKCAEGAALDSACDPCVARVCADNAACCSTAWDSVCVDLVASACDAVCSQEAPPIESGRCVANAADYQDASCMGYDLALAVPCDDQVPVCNHGTDDFSGSVSVEIFDSSTPRMSDPSPPSGAGTCSGSLTIAAGACSHLTCRGLPTNYPLTLYLDPNHVLSECGPEQRNLDGWSVHDGRSCDAESMSDYEYRAVCSTPGTRPAWGLLTWNAEIPGSTEVEFLGRLGRGDTDAEARANAQSHGFTELAIADSSLEECAPSGPLPCPVDLTEKFGPPTMQGHHLDLRIRLKSQGGENPSLSDWNITYSCIYDQ